jgi:hypothetical protein
MTEESRFNGEYQKTGAAEVTDADKKRVEKENAKLIELLGEPEEDDDTS